MSIEPEFIHIYIPPADISIDETLLLLHGTGGDEESLVPVAGRILPGAGILSPRGKVLESGMPRFFRRLSEGVFDLEDLRLRTGELAEFIIRASEIYSLDRGKLTAVGYSNGANIAASILLTYAGVIPNAVLFHPMVPFIPESLPDLSGTDVLITAGTNDPIVSPEGTEDLAELLKKAGALVEVFWQGNGHNLTRDEITAAKSFLSESRT
ncbi:MAG TPA: alpha/beta hydrolase [Thermodesulfobacteriota bacterium]|nr:alpha/beta hydrolase [Thermodesulfobacteriota bacterium]